MSSKMFMYFTVTLDVPSQCLQVERANTKSNAIYKKGVTTQRVYKVKQRCRAILNLEEKMRWSLRQA